MNNIQKFKIYPGLIAFICAIIFYNASAENLVKPDSVKSYSTPSVTVTSTRANAESPIPFSEITKAEIEKNYSTQDIPALLSGLPSVIFYSENGNSVGYSNLTMRGFNQRRISVMINGIPQNDPEDHNVYWIDFPDLTSSLDNIQVQRGAGLINYGSAAIGGSINLSTSNYTTKRGITISSGMGFQQYDDKIQANINKQSIEIASGLTGNYSFYARLSRIYSDGYRDRSFADLNSYFLSAVRFDENLTTQINVFGGPISDGLAYQGSPKSWNSDPTLRRKNLSYWAYDSTGKTVSYSGDRRSQEIENFSQPHFEILNDWQSGEKVRVLSSLFYYQGDGFFDYDGSWADTTMLRITSNQGFHPTVNPGNTVIRAIVANKQFGWVPRVLIDHTDGQLLLGAELRFHRSEHYAKINYADNLPSDYNPDYKFYFYNGLRNTFSLFGRERYDISPKLSINLEAQVVTQKYAINGEKSGNLNTIYKDINGETIGNGGDVINLNYLFVNPRIGANYTIDESNSAYVFTAITSREPRMRNLYAADDSYFGASPLFEGKVNTDGSVSYDFTKPIVKPERMLDIEAGYNYTSDKLQFGLNLYWMEYYNELVKSGQIDIFGNPIEGNADRTRHIGAELLAKLTLFEKGDSKLALSGNATISQNSIIKYDWIISKDPNTNAVKTISLTDNQISGFPDFMANIRLDYSIAGFSASIVGTYVGAFRTDNFGDMLGTNQDLIKFLGSGYYADNKIDPHFVSNAFISYKIDKVISLQSIRFNLSANNIFNSLFIAGGEGKDFFPAAERNFFLGIELGI